METVAYISATIYNLGLFILIGWCTWFLKSPLPLLGLMMVKLVEVNKCDEDED